MVGGGHLTAFDVARLSARSLRAEHVEDRADGPAAVVAAAGKLGYRIERKPPGDAVLGASDAISIHRGDAIRFIEKLSAGAFDVAFADPPYDHGLAAAVADRWLAVPFAAVLGVEHAVKEKLPGADTRRYGDTAISFYRVESPVPSP